MSHRKKPAPSSSPAPRFDLEYVRAAARSRWPEILAAFGLPPDSLSGEHCPCPRCAGTDRFRFSDLDGNGSAICNQCLKSAGDGFAVLQWFTGKKFAEVLALVAEYLGIQPEQQPASGGKSKGKNGKPYNKNSPADPSESLDFAPTWDDGDLLRLAVWCTWKAPITPAAVLSAGGRIARYQGRHDVIALPIWGEHLDAAPPVGYCLYNLTGGTLPRFAKNKQTGKWEVAEQLKVKLTHGSKPGIIADLARLRSARVVVKVEGPSDMLGLLSLPDLPDDYCPVTNANGCGERPAGWMLDLIAGTNLINPVDVARESLLIVHDADVPGQAGAIGRTNDRGEFQPGWANYLAPMLLTRNVVLPFPIVDTHGQDLRDFLTLGSTPEVPVVTPFADFLALVDASPIVEPDPAIVSPAADPDSPSPLPSPALTSNEAEDDPHRLARVNLDLYSSKSGGTIRYWRSEWYTWKESRPYYRMIDEKEFRAKLGLSIKGEFDRINMIAQQSSEGNEDPDPVTRKVTKPLVTNVLEATASTQVIPFSVEPMTWIGNDGKRCRQNYVAMNNGVLDLDRIMADEDDCIIPHSPNWFSTVCLPYNFDPDATCPRWERFLERSLEQDPERIKILQEWAGYCLKPDTSQQKFLAMEGEGGNGKSVFMAGLQAMLGDENCSHIGLERLTGDSFDTSETYGKLVNICADVGEVDKLSEGNLKSFTSGDVMSFRRKYLGVLKTKPTARLVLSFNKRPRFHDPTNGIWRRMLLIPWRIQISDRERVFGMDSAEWWSKSGELPGMFNWALIGLHRLIQQRQFTASDLVKESIQDYKDESNPAQAFLREYFEENLANSIKSSTVYYFYCVWAEKNGYRLMNERTFGKEVKRVFPLSQKARGGGRSSRYWSYSGISFSQDEICGEKTSETELF